MSFFQMPTPIAARRLFIGRSGLMLSGAAVALLAGRDALAATSGAADPRDVQILNTALGGELEAMHWAVLRQALGETPVPSAFMA